MGVYEYKVVPAPARGVKAKGVKTPEGRFALSVEGVLNQMGAEGWEYLRAELLPHEARSGLTGTATQWRNVLVFRRAVAEDAVIAEPVAPPAGEVVALSVVASEAGGRLEPEAPAPMSQEPEAMAPDPEAPAAVAQDGEAPEVTFRRHEPSEPDPAPRTPPAV